MSIYTKDYRVFGSDIPLDSLVGRNGMQEFNNFLEANPQIGYETVRRVYEAILLEEEENGNEGLSAMVENIMKDHCNGVNTVLTFMDEKFKSKVDIFNDFYENTLAFSNNEENLKLKEYVMKKNNILVFHSPEDAERGFVIDLHNQKTVEIKDMLDIIEKAMQMGVPMSIAGMRKE